LFFHLWNLDLRPQQFKKLLIPSPFKTGKLPSTHCHHHG